MRHVRTATLIVGGTGLLCCGGGSTEPNGPSVSGRWTAVFGIIIGGGSQCSFTNLILNLHQSGQTISGSYGPGGIAVCTFQTAVFSGSVGTGSVSGTLIGDSLRLSLSGINAHLSGRLSGDTIADGLFNWTAVFQGLPAGTILLTGPWQGQKGLVTGPGPVASVTITPSFDSTYVGGQVSFSVTARDSAGTVLPNSPFACGSLDTAIATITGVCSASGRSPGTARIVAVGVAGRTDTASVHILPNVASTVGFLGPVDTILTHTTTGLHAFGLNRFGIVVHHPITWRSADTAIATVDSGGVVTAVRGGTVAISAQMDSAVGQAQIVVATLPAFTKLARGVGLICGLGAPTVYCWGPAIPATPIAVPVPLVSMSGGDHACGLTAAGAAYCWGPSNAAGELGTGSPLGDSLPTSVQGGLTFTQISVGPQATCAVTTNGAAYCWGANASGQIGDSTTSNRSAPTPVNGGIAFKEIVTGGQGSGLGVTCGLDQAGASWCWGSNHDGVFGTGDTTYSTFPVPMAGGLRFDSISVGSAHACGLTSAGAAYCWGANIYGELGDNTLVNHHVPGAVSGGGIWGSISASYFFTCALSATATASCWGINETFQLGNGTQTQRLIPTALPAPSLAQIVTLDHSACGLTAAGAVYCWGSGFGTTPTPIPGSVVP